MSDTPDKKLHSILEKAQAKIDKDKTLSALAPVVRAVLEDLGVTPWDVLDTVMAEIRRSEDLRRRVELNEVRIQAEWEGARRAFDTRLAMMSDEEFSRLGAIRADLQAVRAEAEEFRKEKSDELRQRNSGYAAQVLREAKAP